LKGGRKEAHLKGRRKKEGARINNIVSIQHNFVGINKIV